MLKRWHQCLAAHMHVNNSLRQWFPTGVPRHPRVPFTITKGAER